MTTATSPLHALLAKLNGVRPLGDGYQARCPAHGDNDPSLSLNEGDDGRALLHCHAGCTAEEIVGALGLTLADLFPDGPKSGPASRTEYKIRDINGNVVAVHVREDKPHGRKTIRWRGPDGRWGLGGMKVKDMPLYGTELLRDPPEGSTVVITEGEKAADALRGLGFMAVGTVTGARGTPGDDALRPLLRFSVLLWPDNDDGGRQHMSRIAARLKALHG
jgi:hypothetical protein